MDVSERIFYLLKQQGKKQKDLAEYLQTGTSTITGWKQENRNPSLNMIMPICEFLNISVEYLLTGKESPIVLIEVSEPHKIAIKKYLALNQEHQANIRGMIDLYTAEEQISAVTEKEIAG